MVRRLAGFLAAVFVVAQLVGATAGAAAPAGPLLDAFGNPLCLDGSGRGAGDGAPQPHADCCQAGCCVAGCSAPLAADGAAAAAAWPPAARLALPAPARRVVRDRRPEHDPALPRPPPGRA